ncbi:MAG: hypothetical protein F6K58_02825 [Symploca sp. SIO2E9]|nr:hypothetical protein [Symploca sp. SIO2E9]
MISSCGISELSSPSSWDTYHNPRYNFEFPYPSNWQALPMPENLDGQVFRDPQNPSVEIRGWAKLLEAAVSPTTGVNSSSVETQLPKSTGCEIASSQPQNFTTNQGFRGKMQVEIGEQISSMKLTLSQGEVVYNWQGQSKSETFADYYRLFYEIASEYRIPTPED